MSRSPKLPVFELNAEASRRVAFAYVFFVFIFETYVAGVEYSSSIIELLAGRAVFSAVAGTVFVALSFYLVYELVRTAIVSSWMPRAVCFAVMTVSLLVEYSYQKALGRFFDVSDVELALATTFEQKVASTMMYLGFGALVPLGVFLMLLLVTRSERPGGFRRLVVVNFAIVASVLVLAFASVGQFSSLSTFAFYRTSVEFVVHGPIAEGRWDSEVTGITLARLPVKMPTLPEGYAPDNNVVFVIDESTRGDHFSLNGYERPTTPFLDDLQRKGVLHNWGIAAAASTGSHTSYNTIITGLTPDDFPGYTQQKLKITPTIFQYAKAMGYTTWFFDGQMDFFWGGIKDDRRFIDNWTGAGSIKAKGVEGWDIDAEIARQVNRIVSGSKGNFVFVFKHGSHVPYHRNFPAERAMWQPSYVSTKQFDIPGSEKLAEVVNAYDNAIHYSVNSFFSNLIDDYERIPNNTVILYTGDHGQTLFANGKASHSGSTREEATVPLLMIGSPGTKIDTGYKASHSNIYPTILDLLNYPAELRERGSSLSLLKATAGDSRQRFYNPSYGAKLAFDR